MDENVWVLVNPDNEHWDEEDAMVEITYLAEMWDLEVTPTGMTRDVGFGQERLFIVSGSQEAIEEFKEGIEEALY